MIVYKVRSKEFDDIEHIHFKEKSAAAHVTDINGRFNDNDFYYEADNIDSVAKQSVNIDGDVVGYQFSRTKHGCRTLIRKVSNLSRQNGEITGVVVFKGRRVTVNHKWSNYWETVNSQLI